MRQVNGQTAQQIAEVSLEITGKALLSDDFATFAACFHLPHSIETPDHKRVLNTPEDLRSMFDAVAEDYRRKRVTELVRYCEVAAFESETRIKATYMSHMLAGDQRVHDPFPIFSVLEFIDGRWQCVSSQYAVDTNTTVGRAIAASAQDD
ncbi:hypothetical protein [Sulfitobacter aestuariivivens]|uniref:Uncharacterized protein n=1 Tax=Sulfitobacter aestuariivivens TaxID=2766981 RepID=A0A927HGI5_9RHOB|nr:hypothetical protein [Sulfitobacter aestuariivivens]MBD3664285.1 hypothetical protein [Sulfitobacter aestuariivivens]